MAKFVKAILAADLDEGKGRVVRIEGRNLALFRVGDEFFAMDNFCLHRGGPLGEGSLDGYDVTCPWHGWRYDVRTGAFKIITALKVRTYAVKREGDFLYIELDGSAASS